jgi:hypothetical protein
MMWYALGRLVYQAIYAPCRIWQHAYGKQQNLGFAKPYALLWGVISRKA